MPRITAENVQNIPYGPLGIIALPGCEELAKKIDNYLVKWRKNQAEEQKYRIFCSPGDSKIYRYHRRKKII